MADEVTDTAIPQTPPRPSNLVGICILGVWIALGALLARGPGPVGPLTFGFVLAGWVLSVMAHEFSHAVTAWLAGDHTVKAKGYLSFDPRRYGDLGVSLVIPLVFLILGGIAFPGGAVYLRHDLMRGPAWRAAAALAGPAATLAILLILASILRVWGSFGGGGPLYEALTVLAFLQAMAAILNLLPVPGLDGFGAIRPFLPAGLAPSLRRAEGLVLVAFLVCFFLVPGASGLLFAAAAQLAAAVGLPLEALPEGWRAFRFWR